MTIEEITVTANICKARVTKVKGTDNTYIALSFPYKMNVNFKDYINANCEVVKQDKPDNFSITFKI